MNKKYPFICILLFLINITFGQIDPENFDLPLQIELLKSGTFGELRNDHFHSGIDFSTSWKTGIPVYATADGIVNRIRIGTYGYGKALYIRHQNGYTTVYAHLEKFADSIQKYVLQQHYELQKFEIELFPTYDQFLVKKGQLIGYTGNTGSSGGPHLHYEIRDTQTEEIYNPLLFGLDVAITDTQAPVLNGIVVYPLDENTVINQSSESFSLSLSKVSDGNYRTESVYADGVLGFAVSSHDTSNKSRGRNGLYHLKQSVNGTTTYEIMFDRFSFDASRYVNRYIDYERMKLSRQWFQKMFHLSSLSLPFLKREKNKGQLIVEEGNSYNVVLILADFFGNKTTVTIPVVYKKFENKTSKEKRSGKFIDYQRDYIFEEENVYVEWKAYTFYNDVYLNMQLEKNKVVLHKDIIPVQENIDIRFDVTNMDINKEKSFIGSFQNGKVRYYSTWKRENDFRIRTKTLGTYEIFQDTIPPVVFKDGFTDGQVFKYTQSISFEIKDDLSGIDSYEVLINNQWALFEYDYKTQKITHQLSDKIAQEGNNKVKIFVKDRVGNYINFETHFQL